MTVMNPTIGWTQPVPPNLLPVACGGDDVHLHFCYIFGKACMANWGSRVFVRTRHNTSLELIASTAPFSFFKFEHPKFHPHHHVDFAKAATRAVGFGGRSSGAGIAPNGYG